MTPPSFVRPPQLELAGSSAAADASTSGRCRAFGRRFFRFGFSAGAADLPLVDAVKAGCDNLKRHVENVKSFGVPVVVAINQFLGDTEAELEAMLSAASVDVIKGPVERIGGKDIGSATGTSRYIRDPEDNLLEFIIYP